MKQQLRYFLSELIKISNSTELIRSFYFRRAEHYVKQIDPRFLKSAWIRRSTVSQDFFPVMSDVDLTLVIRHEHLRDFFQIQKMKPSFPVNDVQLIGDVFEKYWLETGGFRNRQIRNWEELVTHSQKLQASASSHKEHISFELGHEIHLLYRQIQKLLSQPADGSRNFSLNKLFKEMERTKLYWNHPEDKVLFESRNCISIPEDYFQHLQLLDRYWKELLQNLHPSLTQFKWQELVLDKNEYGFNLNLQIDGKWVLLIESPVHFEVALKNFPDHFVVTSSYITLIKGIGVQEQALLNEVAKADPAGYYYKFNLQRLYHDLLGAITFNSDNYTQLYFCFLNIEMFLHSQKGSFSIYWEEIDSCWKSSKKIPAGSEGNLTDLVLGYLDLLVGLS